jgi:hypothetical protein
MLNLLHEDFGPASDTVLARREYGAATAVPRDEAPLRPARRRTLAALTEALSSTRRGFGD